MDVHVRLGINVIGYGAKGDLEAAALGNRRLKKQVEKFGGQMLADTMMKPSFPYSMAHMARERVTQNVDFLSTNARFCVAFVPNAKILEVYQFIQPHDGYGYIELVNVLTDVKKMPEWRDILVQVSLTLEAAQLVRINHLAVCACCCTVLLHSHAQQHVHTRDDYFWNARECLQNKHS